MYAQLSPYVSWVRRGAWKAGQLRGEDERGRAVSRWIRDVMTPHRLYDLSRDIGESEQMMGRDTLPDRDRFASRVLGRIAGACQHIAGAARSRLASHPPRDCRWHTPPNVGG